jgi:hypothetical protein
VVDFAGELTFQHHVMNKLCELNSQGASDPLNPSEKISLEKLVPNLSLKHFIDDFLEALPALYTLHLTPYTLHPAPYILHPTPYTLHPTLYTLHPKSETQIPVGVPRS